MDEVEHHLDACRDAPVPGPLGGEGRTAVEVEGAVPAAGDPDDAGFDPHRRPRSDLGRGDRVAVADPRDELAGPRRARRDDARPGADPGHASARLTLRARVVLAQRPVGDGGGLGPRHGRETGRTRAGRPGRRVRERAEGRGRRRRGRRRRRRRRRRTRVGRRARVRRRARCRASGSGPASASGPAWAIGVRRRRRVRGGRGLG